MAGLAMAFGIFSLSSVFMAITGAGFLEWEIAK